MDEPQDPQNDPQADIQEALDKAPDADRQAFQDASKELADSGVMSATEPTGPDPESPPEKWEIEQRTVEAETQPVAEQEASYEQQAADIVNEYAEPEPANDNQPEPEPPEPGQ